jgi:hypothetical protein
MAHYVVGSCTRDTERGSRRPLLLRTATKDALGRNLATLFADLQNADESLLVREKGLAVGDVLTGAEYLKYREWLAERAWAMIDEARARNAHLDPDEIYDEVTRIVEQVRKEQRDSRAAS